MPTTADVIAKTLRAYETEVFFCVTGGDHALWIALHDAGIRVVNCRSEAGATYMADGYARLSGRPGFVYGQAGPGAANVAAALADPYWAMSPVISLTGAMRMAGRSRFEYQDLDQLPLHGPVTIWNEAVETTERAAPMVRAAIRIATGTVPGPVHIEIPSDVLRAEAGEVEVYRDANVGKVGSTRIPPPVGAMAAVLERLSAAERPLILAGGGVVVSEAWEDLTHFAEALRIPVVTSLAGKGSIDEEHELAVGLVGRYSRKVANDVLGEADCILAIGTRLGGMVTDSWRTISAGTAILHIDVDARVLAYNYREDLSVVADAKLALQEGLALARERHAHVSNRAWASSVTGRVAEWKAEAVRWAGEEPADGVHPARVIEELHKVLSRDDVIVADTGYMAAWAGALYPVAPGRNFIRAAGSLGWAYPAALGAALATPGRRTVAVTGDGGMGYHLSELETAVRCGIPAVAVILNNQSLAFEDHIQRHLWDGRVISEVNDFAPVDFAAVARAFGAHGVRVESADELPEALAAALQAGGPAVVDVAISKAAIGPVTNYEHVIERAV